MGHEVESCWEDAAWRRVAGLFRKPDGTWRVARILVGGRHDDAAVRLWRDAIVSRVALKPIMLTEESSRRRQ